MKIIINALVIAVLSFSGGALAYMAQDTISEDKVLGSLLIVQTVCVALYCLCYIARYILNL